VVKDGVQGWREYWDPNSVLVGTPIIPGGVAAMVPV
jgi:hypothetical protein